VHLSKALAAKCVAAGVLLCGRLKLCSYPKCVCCVFVCLCVCVLSWEVGGEEGADEEFLSLQMD
jgi:hypothetical protein